MTCDSSRLTIRQIRQLHVPFLFCYFYILLSNVKLRIPTFQVSHRIGLLIKSSVDNRKEKLINYLGPYDPRTGTRLIYTDILIHVGLCEFFGVGERINAAFDTENASSRLPYGILLRASYRLIKAPSLCGGRWRLRAFRRRVPCHQNLIEKHWFI